MYTYICLFTYCGKLQGVLGGIEYPQSSGETGLPGVRGGDRFESVPRTRTPDKRIKDMDDMQVKKDMKDMKDMKYSLRITYNLVTRESRT